MHSNFILNLYIVKELNNWPHNPTNFPIKNYLFGTVKLVRNTIKSRFNYNGQRIAFVGKSLWSFGSNFARNVVIFGIDNSSPSDTDNLKNNFLVLGEGPTDSIYASTGAAEKYLVSTLVKQR